MNKKADRFNRQLDRSRRNFLEMMGKMSVSPGIFKASSIAAAALGARFAEANALDEMKLITIYHPNGAPDGAYLNGAAMTPFDAHRDDIAALEMTISEPGGHGSLQKAAGALSYSKNDIHSSSYDFQAASVLNAMTPKGVLAMGVLSENGAGIHRNRAQSVSRFNNPQDAFNAMFSGGGSGSGGDSSGEFAKRRSVLDINKAGIDLIRSKLGAEERARLDLHTDAIATLEKQLNADEALANQNSGGGSCGGPTLGAATSALQTYKAQGDIAVAALACGITNVASIQFSETQAGWYANDGTADAVDWVQDHHKANHANGAHKLPELVGYMNKGIAHIVSELKKAGIFDKTVVVCFSEMGDGQGHSAENGPIVVASGINGFQAARKNVGDIKHTTIFSDVTNLLGLEAAVGNTVYNYGGGGYVI